MGGDDRCAELSALAPAVIPEVVGRGNSAPHVQVAVVVAPAHDLPPPNRRVFGYEPGHLVLPEAQPLDLPLRI